MILRSLVGALIQLVVFGLLPFLAYLISNKTLKGFFRYTGLQRATSPAMLTAALAGLLLGGLGIAVLCFSLGIRQSAAGHGTVPEQIRQFASPANRIVLILIVAFIKTALAEELLFRGFIAKRLLAQLGYLTGNLLQAVIFGAVHVLLFLSISGVSPAFLIFSFLLPGTAGYLAGYLNEQMGNGSIYPGWVLHGLCNLISYLFLIFVY